MQRVWKTKSDDVHGLNYFALNSPLHGDVSTVNQDRFDNTANQKPLGIQIRIVKMVAEVLDVLQKCLFSHIERIFPFFQQCG